MGTLLRAPRADRPTASIPAATALSIQTSIQGRPRPIGWGTAVLAGNLIDIVDFQPVPVINNSSSPQGHAGKGGMFRASTQGAQPTYSWVYYANVLISLCEGPIQSVNRFTGDGITLGTYPSGAAGGTVFTGTQSQAAWSFMTTQHPSRALPYRGEAYIAFGPMYLGEQSAVPSFKFEVTFGICGAGSDFPSDANPKDVVTDFLTNTQYGIPGFSSSLLADLTAYGAYCQAAGLVVSPILADQTEASGFIGDLMRATNSEVVWSNGKLNIVPYGDVTITAHGATFVPNDTPVYDLTVDDFLELQGGTSDGGKTAIAITRKSAQDLSNNVRVEYLDRTNTYIAAEIDHKDEASITMTRERPTDVRTLHMFALQSAASMSAALQLVREQSATTYSFTLPRSFVLLDPMDLVSLPLDAFGLSDEPQVVRIKEIQENDDYTLTFTAENFDGTATAPLYARQGITHGVPDFNADPGDINTPILFEPPFNIGEPALAVFCAISGQNPALWGGADVYVSYDATNYILVDQLKGASRMGVTTAVLPSVSRAGTDPTIDNTNALAVNLTESLSTLSSASAADMNNGNTACWLADTGEIVAYQTPTLTGANRYSLAPLQRGAFGTPITSHPIGTSFVRIDGTVFRLPYDKSRVGATVYVKFVSFNVYGGGRQTIDAVSAYSYVIQGAALNSEYHYTPEVLSIAGTDHVLVVGADGSRKKAPLTAVEALLAAEGTLASEIATLNAAVVSANAAIATANAAIATANTAIGTNQATAHSEFLTSEALANSLFATAETDIGAVSSTVTTEIATRSNADKQLAVKVDNVATAAPGTDWSDYNDFFGAIRGDVAAKTAIGAKNTAAIAYAGVQTIQASLLQQGLAFASLSTTVAAQIGDVQGYVNTEALARVAGDTANANSIAIVRAEADANSAAITVLQSVTSNPSGVFASIETTLQAGYNSGDDFSALTDFFAAIQAGKNNKATVLQANVALAGVQTLTSSLADTNQSIASSMQSVGALFGSMSASIRVNATAIANANTAIATLQTEVEASGTGLLSRVSTAETAISNDHSAIATLQTEVEASGSGLLSKVSSLQTAMTTVGSAVATLQTEVETSSTGLLSRVSTVESSMSTVNTAVATLRTEVETSGTGLLSRVSTVEGSMTYADSAISTLQTEVEASFTGLLARVATVESAFTGPSGSVATLEREVEASSTGLLARVTTTESAIATVNGTLAARYTIALDANGNIASLSLISGGGSTSRVSFLADNFTIASPSHPDLVVFGILNIAGTPQIALNGNKVADLSLLNNALGPNSVTNAGSSTGHSGGNSGTVTLTVRNGSRVVITAFYAGGDQFPSTTYVGGQIDITYDDGTHGPVTKTFSVVDSIYAGGNNWFATTAVVALSGVTGGTWTVSAHSHAPAHFGFAELPFTVGDTTILVEEFAK